MRRDITDPKTGALRLTSLQSNTPSLVSAAHGLVPTLRGEMTTIMNQLRAPFSSELTAIPRIDITRIPK